MNNATTNSFNHEEESLGMCPSHVRALSACPILSDQLKEDSIRKSRVEERKRFMMDLFNQWYTIGYYGVENMDEDEDGVDWMTYVHRNMTNEEVRTTFKILTKCGCCARHKDIDGTNNHSDRTCKCSCRHHARAMRKIIIHTKYTVPLSCECVDIDEVNRLRNCFEE